MKIKSFAVILFLFAVIVFSTTISVAQLPGGISGIPPELQEKIDDLLATRYPPIIKEVKLTPEAPAADSPVTIEATVYNNSEVTDDETSEVKVLYSADGGTVWSIVELEQTDNAKVWKGEIPEQPAGTEVLYFIRAADSSGNVATELSCTVPEWPLSADYVAAGNCAEKEGEDKTACLEDITPRECMFASARDDNPLDDEEALVPNDFDFWDYRVGYDEDNLYINIRVEGKVSQGTASPMDVHGYVAGVLNPDMGESGGTVEALLTQGVLLLYAPLATISGGLVKPCAILYSQGGNLGQNDKDITCTAKGENLFFKVKRSALNDNPSNTLTLLVAGAGITSISPPAGNAYDNSHFTKITLNSRSYKVE